ncbi:FAD-dependent oxidoreductase [Streptomyces sp. NPDC005526]|uniref:FAD-dependent oxidoreductase n=1 Tax=Streptomyces sp. NPDC005526 TaxID=3156885 RepID=UPI0033BCC469
MKIAVIGLGVLGASVARSLALMGAHVIVLERAGAMDGTSGTSFAWINSHSQNPRSYHDLNVAGTAERSGTAPRNRPDLAGAQRKPGADRRRGRSRTAHRLGHRTRRPRVPGSLDQPGSRPSTSLPTWLDRVLTTPRPNVRPDGAGRQESPGFRVNRSDHDRLPTVTEADEALRASVALAGERPAREMRSIAQACTRTVDVRSCGGLPGRIRRRGRRVERGRGRGACPWPG